ncbi:MAG: methyltransferase domain-containing protein [bacterium]|nr:methyltransferase domain-containing protein [bacterium]
MNSRQQQISASFDRAAEYYEMHGLLQKKAALELLARLPKWLADLPEGEALELGAGTGLVSEFMAQKLAPRPLTITDLSQAMLLHCQEKLGDRPGLSYERRDASLPLAEARYALILSALALQWLPDPYAGLKNYCRALVPGGKLIFSVMVEGSFAQWREEAAQLGLPYTANPLPSAEQIAACLAEEPGEVELVTRNLPVKFPKARDFFFNLKAIGAAVALGPNRLNAGQMKRLMAALDRTQPSGLTMDHQICFACFKRHADT